MFKKLAITGAAAAMLLGSAAGAFAYGGWYHHGSSTEVKNYGDINNDSWNVANTGFNRASGWHSDVRTGNASASQVTTNILDTNVSCGCTSGRHGSTEVKNYGDIDNTSVNVANSGVNSARWGGDVRTGNASAGQDVLNVVNTSVGSSAE